MKYILGVNKKSSNIAVTSELGRYPLYFYIILSMLKYYHRLHNSTNMLLHNAYICCKELHNNNVNTWFSSIEYILNKLGISTSCDLKTGIHSFTKWIKDKLYKNYLNFWRDHRNEIIQTEKGKLNTYFSLKTEFGFEKYLHLKDFKLRQVICKIRISAHPLRIETDRYKKNYVNRTLRKCLYCNLNKIEDEIHFVTECPLYDTQRNDFFTEISSKCKNFYNLDNSSKFVWLFTQENLDMCKSLGCYLCENLIIRRFSKILNTK